MFRYNLPFQVHVRCFYPYALQHAAFGEALAVLNGRRVDGRVVGEHGKKGPNALSLCRTGRPNHPGDPAIR